MDTKTDKTDFSSKDVNPTSSTQKEERKPQSNLVKNIYASVIFFGNVAFGCGFTTYGPAITSLQNKYEVDDSRISTVFTILTCGYVLGALAGGIIYNYINRQLAVTTIFAVMAAMMFVTPYCPTLTTFFISAGVMGVCCGSYDAAQVVWMMEMMQKACPPYVLAQHFFYAVGPLLSSSIMAPFLPHNDDEEEKSSLKADEVADDSKLFVPYIIFGSLMVITTVAHLFLFIFMRYRPPPPEILDETETLRDEKTKNGNETKGMRIGKWSLPKLRMVVITAAFFGANVGMEMCMFEFFSKFGQNSSLKLSEKEAAITLTGMTAAYAAFRGVGIIVALKIRPQLILCANIFFITVANIILATWASNSLTGLWFSSILFGMGFSTVFPAFCSYIERYLRFTNFIGGLMIVCGSGVASLYPLIIGKYIEDNPVVLSYTGFFSIFLNLLSFGSLSYLTYKNKTRY